MESYPTINRALYSIQIQQNLPENVLPELQDTYGPPMGKKLILFIDDLNMPRVDLYGTQQPIALLKLFIEKQGLYDKGKELNWKHMKDIEVSGIWILANSQLSMSQQIQKSTAPFVSWRALSPCGTKRILLSIIHCIVSQQRVK